jgi:hypothetical protein
MERAAPRVDEDHQVAEEQQQGGQHRARQAQDHAPERQRPPAGAVLHGRGFIRQRNPHRVMTARRLRYAAMRIGSSSPCPLRETEAGSSIQPSSYAANAARSRSRSDGVAS